MVDIEEIQEDARKSQNQLEKVEPATVPDADRATTLAFIRHEDDQNSVNTGTLVSHLNHLRHSSERAGAARAERP